MGYKGSKKRTKNFILGAVVIILVAAATFFLIDLLIGVVSGVRGATTMPPESVPPAPTEQQYVKKEGVTSYLLAGTDYTGKYTDTILLLYFDDRQKLLNILQIPGDTYVSAGKRDKTLGAVYADGGGAALEAEIKNTFGVVVDGYAVMSLAGFRTAVDKIGGVKYNVPAAMNYSDPVQGFTIKLSKGLQVLDGKKSEQLVRFVSGYKDGNIDRLKIQLGFMAAFAKQVVSIQNVFKLPSVVSAVFDETATSLSLSDATLLCGKLMSLDMENVRVYTLPGQYTNYQGGTYFGAYVDDAEYVIGQYFNPSAAELDMRLSEIVKKPPGVHVSIDGQSLKTASETTTDVKFK